MEPKFDDRIESWAAEFAGSPEAVPFSPKVRHATQDLLAEFLGGACEEGCDPTQIGEKEVRAGLLGRVASMPLDDAVRPLAPDVVAAYIKMLGRQGRVANAGPLSSFARALRQPFLRGEGAPKGVTFHREAPKLGPNDPCPCGSGKKWKKCCRLTLGD